MSVKPQELAQSSIDSRRPWPTPPGRRQRPRRPQPERRPFLVETSFANVNALLGGDVRSLVALQQSLAFRPRRVWITPVASTPSLSKREGSLGRSARRRSQCQGEWSGSRGTRQCAPLVPKLPSPSSKGLLSPPPAIRPLQAAKQAVEAAANNDCRCHRNGDPEGRQVLLRSERQKAA